MTDKPIDLSATEDRAVLRDMIAKVPENTSRPWAYRLPCNRVARVLDALDARETLVVAGNGEKFTMAQAEQIAKHTDNLAGVLRADRYSHVSTYADDAARMIRYLAAMLDAANVRLERMNYQYSDTEREHTVRVEISDGRPMFRAVESETPESLQEIGASFLTAIEDNRNHLLLKNWQPMNDPAEIIPDLLNAYDSPILPPPPPPIAATPERILEAAQVLENEIDPRILVLSTGAKYAIAKRMLLAAGLSEA